MKFNLIGITVALISFSCGSSNWTKADRDQLKERCLSEGGSRSYCNCYLENAMKAYPNAEDMENISFEQAVELSLNCK